MNRSYSLKRHKEFRYTYRVGKSVGAHLFSLIWAKNRTDSVKVGFSVSKKVGNSVQRNRAKRRLRACITPMLESIRKGTNLVFIARRDVLDVPFAEMQRQMTDVLKRAGLLEKTA
ncbi:MAG: ribonuclease P protein component [Clostridia bacterium]|nr:ribonuclease P protein component [Clostridia bacterium]